MHPDTHKSFHSDEILNLIISDNNMQSFRCVGSVSTTEDLLLAWLMEGKENIIGYVLYTSKEDALEGRFYLELEQACYAGRYEGHDLTVEVKEKLQPLQWTTSTPLEGGTYWGRWRNNPNKYQLSTWSEKNAKRYQGKALPWCEWARKVKFTDIEY